MSDINILIANFKRDITLAAQAYNHGDFTLFFRNFRPLLETLAQILLYEIAETSKLADNLLKGVVSIEKDNAGKYIIKSKRETNKPRGRYLFQILRSLFCYTHNDLLDNKDPEKRELRKSFLNQCTMLEQYYSSASALGCHTGGNSLNDCLQALTCTAGLLSFYDFLQNHSLISHKDSDMWQMLNLFNLPGQKNTNNQIISDKKPLLDAQNSDFEKSLQNKNEQNNSILREAPVPKLAIEQGTGFYDLIIFACDGCLLYTYDLKALRDYYNIQKYPKETLDAMLDAELIANPHRLLFTSNDLKNILKKAGCSNIAIFDQAPQAYLEQIIKRAYPDIKFIFIKQMICNESDNGDSASLEKILSSYGAVPARTLFVGSSACDRYAALQADCAFCMQIKSSIDQHFMQDKAAPFFTINGANDLLDRLNNPPQCFTKMIDNEDSDFICSQIKLSSSPPIWVHSIGSYFSSIAISNLPILKKHALSNKIRQFKNTGEPSQYFIDKAVEFIFKSRKLFRDCICIKLVPIPAHKGKIPRMENLTFLIAQKCAEIDLPFKVENMPDMLVWTEKAHSQREVASIDRRLANAAANLQINPKYQLSNFQRSTGVLIIDDVVTTGATVMKTFEILKHKIKFKAAVVFCLAKTVHISKE